MKGILIEKRSRNLLGAAFGTHVGDLKKCDPRKKLVTPTLRGPSRGGSRGGSRGPSRGGAVSLQEKIPAYK